MTTAFSLTFPFVVIVLPRRRSHISSCYLYTAVIILCVPSPPHSLWYSTLFTITGFAAHSQYRWRVMNKLSISAKARSSSEFTCIRLLSLRFWRRPITKEYGRRMCPVGRKWAVVNGRPSGSTWIIHSSSCCAAQPGEVYFKQREHDVCHEFLFCFVSSCHVCNPHFYPH